MDFASYPHLIFQISGQVTVASENFWELNMLYFLERNQKISSNPSLIMFLTIEDLSSARSDLLHLGAPVRALIRVEKQPSPLPAPAGTFLPGMRLPVVSIHFLQST